MPSRPIVALVVLIWLATTAWLFYQEWWPWLATDGPPPFVIDPVDEAAPQSASWTLYRDGQELGNARTAMIPQRDDTFDLVTELPNLEVAAAGITVKFPKIEYVCKVNRSGEMLGMAALIELEAGLGLLRSEIQLSGVVRGDQLWTKAKLRSPLFHRQKFELDLDPVALPTRNVVSTLTPLMRFRGLTHGRTWRVTAVDPLTDALVAWIRQTAKDFPQIKGMVDMLGKMHDAKAKELVARVKYSKEKIHWDGEDRPCLVIEYTGPDVTAHTWVRADSTAEVLRQEVESMGQRLTFERDDLKAPRK